MVIQNYFQVYIHVKSILVKSSYWKELFDSKLHTNSIWSFYQNDPWNVLDFIAFTLWIVGLITRFIVRDTAFAISK